MKPDEARLSSEYLVKAVGTCPAELRKDVKEVNKSLQVRKYQQLESVKISCQRGKVKFFWKNIIFFW